MATSEKETFLVWLRDAYALERKLVPELQAHAAEAAHLPEVQAKIQEHIATTERQAETVRGIIEGLGGEVSTLKTLTGEVMGFMMGMSTALAADVTVKNALAEFTMEHMEIASYTSLIAAAERLNLPSVAQTLRGILAEEREMAQWLEIQIPVLTTRFMSEVGAKAQST